MTLIVVFIFLMTVEIEHLFFIRDPMFISHLNFCFCEVSVKSFALFLLEYLLFPY